MSKKKNILLAITNGLWLIDSQSAEALGTNVAAVLQGKSFWDIDHKSKAEYLIIEGNDSSLSPSGSFFSSTLDKARPGSVAVISISGPIMKDDNCGDPGTKTYESLIQQAAANPNITGIVLQIDSPGGTVSGTQSLSNVIKNVEKPVVTLAEDTMASAAYWIGSAANYIFANTGTTRVGSIGTMLSFADMQPVWEKAGVKFHEIYASKSTDKNADFAEIRKGNYEGYIKNTLDPLNNEFLNSVKANRGEKLVAEKTLSGMVYTANDAITYGLVDAIGNLNDAVAKVHELASDNSTTGANQIENLEKQNMKKLTLNASHVALLAVLGATIAEGQSSVEVELTDDSLTAIESALAASSKASSDLAAANSQVTTLTAKVGELEAKVTELGKSNPGSTATVKEGVDKVETESTATDFSCEADSELAEMKKTMGLK